MQVLRHNLSVSCIFTCVSFVFRQHVATLLYSQSLFLGYTFGIHGHQWIHQPSSTSFFPTLSSCHFHLPIIIYHPWPWSSWSSRQNLPPVPFLPPPAAPGGHRPAAPPPAGRGQILDATWGAPQQRPATPAPLWPVELRDGGDNKGWAAGRRLMEVGSEGQIMSNPTKTWVWRYDLQKWR